MSARPNLGASIWVEASAAATHVPTQREHVNELAQRPLQALAGGALLFALHERLADEARDPLVGERPRRLERRRRQCDEVECAGRRGALCERRDDAEPAEERAGDYGVGLVRRRLPEVVHHLACSHNGAVQDV